MENFILFIGNHVGMVSIWLGLVAALIWTEGRRAGKSVTPQQATLLMNREDALVVDVRDRNSFGSGHITGSINIPLTQVKERIAELESYQDQPIIMVCNTGQQAAAAGKLLHAENFSKVMRMTGGINEWRASNLPLVKKEKAAEGKAAKRKKKGAKGGAAA